MNDLEALADAVRAFADARDWGRYHSPRNLAMAVSVEAGELLELFLWTDDHGPQPATPERAAAVADEAADVLICLLNLCNRAGIDLGAAVVEKLHRAERKYPAHLVRGKALKYDEYASWDGAEHRGEVLPDSVAFGGVAVFVRSTGSTGTHPETLGASPAGFTFVTDDTGAVHLRSGAEQWPLAASTAAFARSLAALALDPADAAAVWIRLEQVDPVGWQRFREGWRRWLGTPSGRTRAG